MLKRNQAPAQPLTPRQEASVDAVGLAISALIGVPAGILLGAVINDHLPVSAYRYPVPAYAPPAPGFNEKPLMNTVVPPTTIMPPATVPQGPPNSGYVPYR